MIKKSNLQNAKLKMSKFKEKYSKKIVLNNGVLTESSNETITDHSEAVDIIINQDEVTINDSNEETQNHLKKSSEEIGEFELHTNFTLQVNDYVVKKIQNSNSRSSQSNSLSSSISTSNKVSCKQSVENLKVTKPLENVCFVSSSSHEPTFTKPISFKNTEKPIYSIQPYGTQFSRLDTDGNNTIQISNNSQSVQKISDGSDNNSISLMSEISSKISSIEEISSISDNEENNSNSVSSIGGSIKSTSISDMLKNHETEKTHSKVQQVEPTTFSIAKPSEGSKTTNRNTRQKSNSSPKLCSKYIPFASNITMKRRPNNSDTKSEILYTNSKLTNDNKVADIENIKLTKHVLKKNLRLYKKDRPRMPIENFNDTNAKTFKDIYQHNISLNHSSKQTILKSCKLIRQAETNKDKFEELGLVHKSYRPTSRLGVNQNLFYSENGKDHSCDQVLQQLLRNQIQMTRHFIESHHQMYLHCCQAVKMLSEKYVNNNKNAFQ